jgi:hypothetical protein
MPPQQAKECHVKELNELSCLGRKSCDANSAVGKKADHMTGDMSHTLPHHSHGNLFGKFISVPEFEKIRYEYSSIVIMKTSRVDIRLHVRRSDEIRSIPKTELLELLPHPGRLLRHIDIRG